MVSPVLIQPAVYVSEGDILNDRPEAAAISLYTLNENESMLPEAGGASVRDAPVLWLCNSILLIVSSGIGS